METELANRLFQEAAKRSDLQIEIEPAEAGWRVVTFMIEEGDLEDGGWIMYIDPLAAWLTRDGKRVPGFWRGGDSDEHFESGKFPRMWTPVGGNDAVTVVARSGEDLTADSLRKAVARNRESGADWSYLLQELMPTPEGEPIYRVVTDPDTLARLHKKTAV